MTHNTLTGLERTPQPPKIPDNFRRNRLKMAKQTISQQGIFWNEAKWDQSIVLLF